MALPKGQNAFMICWWCSVHSYCYACGFRGPLGAQGAVGCPLATTHVNHFLRGFVGVNLLGVFFLGMDFVRRGFVLGVDLLGVDVGVGVFQPRNHQTAADVCIKQNTCFCSSKNPPPKNNPKIHPLLLSDPATAAAVTFHSHVRTIGCRAP